MPAFQSDFRMGARTTTAMLDVMDNILDAQEHGFSAILTLLAFYRAFGCTKHHCFFLKCRITALNLKQ